MSIFSNLFGKQGAAELKAEGDEAQTRGRLGDAKLAYERALTKAEAGSPLRAEIDAALSRTRDALAEQRIAASDSYAAGDDLEMARNELEGAFEIAASDAMRARAKHALSELERAQIMRSLVPPAEISEEEQYAATAAAWEDSQAEEYESYGDPFHDTMRAVLALATPGSSETVVAVDGATKPGANPAAPFAEHRRRLEELLAGARAPRFLYLEVGKLRLLDGDLEGGLEALRTFLSKLKGDEGGDSRLVAHLEIARILDEKGDEAGAIAQFEAATNEMEEDPRPFTELGHFLRIKGHHEEAIQVLDVAVSLMGEVRPDLRVLQELGLAHASAQNKERAVAILEDVIGRYVQRGHFDFPPDAALTLATLQEERGDLTRAADLLRSLARGSDVPRRVHYHREAARLLKKLGLADESRRLLTRAQEIAPTEEVRAQVSADLAAL